MVYGVHVASGTVPVRSSTSPPDRREMFAAGDPALETVFQRIDEMQVAEPEKVAGEHSTTSVRCSGWWPSRSTPSSALPAGHALRSPDERLDDHPHRGRLAPTLAGSLAPPPRRRVRHLAFGPGGAGRLDPGRAVAPAAGAAALAFGLSSLMLDVRPRATGCRPGARAWRHLVLVLDVSPSMRLEDAGPDAAQSRTGRARDVLDSIFGRVAIGQYKISIVATYTGAMPVVVDTSDSRSSGTC